MVENFIGITLLVVFLLGTLSIALMIDDNEYFDVAVGMFFGLLLALMGTAGWMLVS